MAVRRARGNVRNVGTADAEFEPRPESVQAARRFVRETLTEWRADDADWVVGQVVSELATNAVLHARTAFRIALNLDADQLRIAVHDASPRQPQLRSFGQEATTGRGLALVAKLSKGWGVESAGSSKEVWCLLDLSDLGVDDEVEPGDLDLDAFLDEFEDGDLDDAGGDGRSVPSALAA